jgi:hypothetical protein
MDENILERNIRRESDRFIEEREPEPNRFRPPKIELFRKNDDAYKFKPLNRDRILKAPVRETKLLRVEPLRNTNKQHIFRHEVIKSKLPKLAPYDIAHPKNKPKQLNQLP